MLCALIMAGGKGTRFWPLSTEDKPKQFLRLIGKETMLQMTVNRIKDLIPMERVFICTGEKYVDLVKEQIPILSEGNIIIEPYGKNTAPCIGLSAFYIKERVEDATIVVLPSDHLIRDEEEFIEVLKAGEEFIEENKKAIITIGITPNRAETGYGYINCGEGKVEYNRREVRKVNKFVEKPSLEKAKEYLKEGNYLWNGGMFIWKAKHILELTKKYMNKTYDVLLEIAASKEEEYYDSLKEKYEQVEELSVDYGIMEKASDIYVIPGDFGWDDVGTWRSVERYSLKDECNNIIDNKSYAYESKENIVMTKKKVLLNNVDNLIIVETDEYIMVSNKTKEQEIKKAQKMMNMNVI